ncbi:LysM peptidoglycan-binding domain-containing protein [Kitasatospora sp. MBT66]|uniref:LysM peptidoglycan-binding domain-containing protein n=1 Tax=Kitasatospora sp. MBT66 TaxID=1444769 RepID=UPI0005B7ABA2|nr:LysM peptidoglycan-binding domain-containing protein [Kitasatospora sp. MBT66]
MRVASADIGYREGPNNDSKYGRAYGLNFNPYCDMAVSLWGQAIGERSAVGWFAYCPSHVAWFKQRGQWLGRNASVVPGDIVFFSWDGGPTADHVGVVRAASTGTADVPTVEANTSSGQAGSQSNGDGVYARTRSRAYILGFGRPAYSGGAPSTTGRHRITKGQTLGGIAAALGVSVAVLLGLNPDIKNPDVVREGQEINVPAKPTAPGGGNSASGGDTSAPAPAPAPNPQPAPGPAPKPPKPSTGRYVPPAYPNGIAPNKARPSARQLQAALKATGYMPKSVAAADNYGPKTQSAVAKWLDAHPAYKERGKRYDPSIGPKGWAALFRQAYGS